MNVLHAMGFFVLGFLLSRGAAVPLSNVIARRVGAIDEPGALKVHETPIPRLGGLGIMLAFLAVCMVAVAVAPHLYLTRRFSVLGGGTLLICVLGLLDDVRGLPQTTKFLFEGTVALLFVILLTPHIAWWLGILTWFWLVGLVNGYNFIDGLDGLASGIAVINLAALAALFFLDGMMGHAIVAVACAGSCLGFLRLNWAPASVFMGDSGSLGLGFLIAGMSVLYVTRSGHSVSRIAAVVLAAGVPVADLAFTFLRRLVGGRSLRPGAFFAGDRAHSYDQMKAGGRLTTRTTVLICYVLGLVLAALALTTHVLPEWSCILCLLAVPLLTFVGVRYKLRLMSS